MKWVVIFINSEDPHYRLFMSYGGGYMSGDNWQMNSGIVRVEEDDNSFVFHGSSGSQYRVSKDLYGMTVYGSGILHTYMEKLEVVSIMPEDTDWTKVDWIITAD